MERFSPFPFIVDNKRYEGVLFKWPERCSKCQHVACSNPLTDDLSICSYGSNYQRIAGSFIIAGFLVKDSYQCGEARKKNLRSHKDWIVSNSHFNHAVDMLRIASEIETKEITDKKQDVIKEYIEKG